MSTVLFVVANLAITLGSVVLAAFALPRLPPRLWRTRLGAVGFLLLCGLGHLQDVAHVLFQGSEPAASVLLAARVLVIDVPQAAFVGLLLTGLYLELVRCGPSDPGAGGSSSVLEPGCGSPDGRPGP